MDHYSAERLLLERNVEIARRAERLGRLLPSARRRPVRVWVASGLRVIADRLDRPPRLQRVV